MHSRVIHKILIVDDDQDDIYFFKQALSKVQGDFQLQHLRNGKELLEHITEHRLDNVSLVLLDLNMPVMDGWETLEKMASLSVKVKWPIIVYTTSKRAEDVGNAYRLGALSYIVKPDTIIELTKILQSTFKYWFDVVEHPMKKEGN
ncbi:response regulator [Alteromonadaceae bacterium BrNp21-10]|nr:response regulator [Alteromonadaceae bacterium BrNp21-10]